jgi:hypothetical protein
VYIETCNLISNVSIHIQDPCLHGGVDSELCRSHKRKNMFGVRVVPISGRGGVAAFPSCKRG